MNARGEFVSVARGGALTFVSAAGSAALGFCFSLLLARLFGAADAGVVLQAVALVTIGTSIARLGTDTTAVWLLPRLLHSAPGAVRTAVLQVVGLAVVGSAGVLLLWFAVVRRLWSSGTGAAVAAVDVLMLCLPAAVFVSVGLGCSRAFGRIVAFNLIDNLLVPAARPLALVLVHVLGAPVAWAALAWGGPFWVGAVFVAVVLARALAPLPATPTRPPGETWREIGSYTVPRAWAQVMEQSLIWVDVLLVGLVAGAAAAGVYGSAARFVAAGTVVATALRIVVAPRFSALLAQGRREEVGELYRVTARWILFFGSPVYLTLALFAPTVLGWLGPEFAAGHAALVLLAFGSVVVLAAGNVQALLLMAGRSRAGALNKTGVVAVNCVGNLLLVPPLGITAAAGVWALSMVLDTALASIQVRRATGIVLGWGSALRLGCGLLVAVGGPMALTVLVLGQGERSLCVAIAGGALGLAVLARVERRVVRLDLLRSTLAGRRTALR